MYSHVLSTVTDAKIPFRPLRRFPAVGHLLTGDGHVEIPARMNSIVSGQPRRKRGRPRKDGMFTTKMVRRNDRPPGLPDEAEDD